MYADPADPGQQVVVAGLLLGAARGAGGGCLCPGRAQQPQAGSSGALGQQVATAGRGLLAAQQYRLLYGEVVWFESVIALLDQPAIRHQQLPYPRGGARSHAGDIFMVERGQRVQL